MIRNFQKHTSETHYIDYPEGVLMRFIMNKKQSSSLIKINFLQE